MTDRFLGDDVVMNRIGNAVPDIRKFNLGVVHKLREQDFGLFLHPPPLL